MALLWEVFKIEIMTKQSKINIYYYWYFVCLNLGNWIILLPKKKINRDLVSSWEWKLINSLIKNINITGDSPIFFLIRRLVLHFVWNGVPSSKNLNKIHITKSEQVLWRKDWKSLLR